MDITASGNGNLPGRVKAFLGILEQAHIDHKTSQRIKSISQALESETEAEKLSRLDIYKAFNLGQFSASAEAAFTPWFVKWLEILRNLLVLIPIFLTWLALSEASKKYMTAVAVSPRLKDFSFLSLWEQGESIDLTPMLRFSAVALIDAGVIISIIVLTAIVMVLVNSASHRASGLTGEFEDLLWEVDSYLETNFRYARYGEAEKKSLEILREVKKFVAEFQNHSKELERTIQIERDNLTGMAAERKRDLEGIKGVSSGLQSASDKLSRFSADFPRLLEGMSARLGQFTAGVEQMAATQATLQQRLDTLNTQLDKIESSVNELNSSQQKVSGEVGGAVAAMRTSHENLITTMARTFQVLHQLQEKNASEITTIVKELRQTHEKSSSDLVGIAGELKKAQGEFSTTLINAAQANADQGQESAAAFARLSGNLASLETTEKALSNLISGQMDVMKQWSGSLLQGMEKMDRVQQAVQTLGASFATLQGLVNSNQAITSALQSAQRESAEAAAGIRAASERFSSAGQDMQALRKSLTDFNAQMQTAQQKMSEVALSVNSIAGNLNQAIGENQRSTAAMTEIQRELRQLTDELRRLQQGASAQPAPPQAPVQSQQRGIFDLFRGR